MEKKNKFITTDLHFATALVTNGMKIIDVRINTANGKPSGVFVIDKSGSDIDKISKNYYDGNLPVDAYTYRNNLKRLKTWATNLMTRGNLNN